MKMVFAAFISNLVVLVFTSTLAYADKNIYVDKKVNVHIKQTLIRGEAATEQSLNSEVPAYGGLGQLDDGISMKPMPLSESALDANPQHLGEVSYSERPQFSEKRISIENEIQRTVAEEQVNRKNNLRYKEQYLETVQQQINRELKKQGRQEVDFKNVR
jgi:hypothetical protein